MYLLLSILCSTLIFIVFKTIDRLQISTLHTIVINYVTACGLGMILNTQPITIKNTIQADWFLGALFLGFLFISIFFVMARTAQTHGVSVASVASKMSVIIPVIFGIIVYNEGTGKQKIAGIILALFAVYWTSLKKNTNLKSKRSLTLPFILFLGSGIIDTSIKYLETYYVPENGIPMFSATIFFIAGSLGFIYLLIKNQWRFTLRNLFSGLILGVINYGSIYFLLKALNHETFESSTLFTINNVGVVMLSTLSALLLFQEDLSKKNWIGISLAIISILLVTLA
ncbi:DMT family transporter [Mangrovimonas sp. AS39]|uniref:DMT family transporter n=1 Tax=Mangrovimonas futianensis TaxID=2895523 RepID=UPI001E41820B|nr:DMT family transporter [Mangrovimonas futianensis]MCF1192621.1 DMT family transporter [Mangrovimonas futianensis]MCF1196458.1 DMT family transporter [Mangrovimonas futianensis]